MEIASLARGAVFDRERPEAPQRDPVAACQRVRHRGEDGVNDGRGLFAHEVMSGCHCRTECAFRPCSRFLAPRYSSPSQREAGD